MKESDYKKRINNVIHYIQENLDTPLTIDVLAGIAFFSRSHFKKVFRDVTGENISDYVKRIRFEKAQYMLLQNQYRSITDIAFETGFSSSASFTRGFKQYFGITPTEFRENNRNESIINFGIPFLRSIPPTEYNGCNTIYSITDDGEGTYYFSSGSGEIYTYNDGQFETIKIPGLQAILSLAYDNEGTLWIGSVSQLGYLKREKNTYSFVSLLDHIPPEEQSFNQIWNIEPTSDGIYFFAATIMFKWHNNIMTSLKPDGIFIEPAFLNGILYILLDKCRLMTLKGKELVSEPVSDQLQRDYNKVNYILPYDEDYVLLISHNMGCFLYDGTQLIPFQTEVDSIRDEATFNRAIHIPGIGYAIGTKVMGVLIIDMKGKLITIVNRKRGLLDNYIRSLHYTGDGRLLIGTMYGCAILNVAQPLLMYDDNAGITAMVNAIIRYRGSLYLATHYAILREKHNYRKNEKIFERLPDVHAQIIDIIESNTTLCFGNTQGLYVINGHENQFFNIKVSLRILCQSSLYSDTLYAASNNCVHRFHYSAGKWKQGEPIELKGRIHGLVEEHDGSLLCCTFGRVYRVIISKDSSMRPVIDCYEHDRGVPNASLGLFKIKGTIYLLSNSMLLCYNREKDCFTEESELGKILKNKEIDNIFEDEECIWVIADREQSVYRITQGSSGTYQIDPILNIPNLRARTIYCEGNGIVWIGCHCRLIRCDMNELRNTIR